jgi:hypothetical protein
VISLYNLNNNNKLDILKNQKNIDVYSILELEMIDLIHAYSNDIMFESSISGEKKLYMCFLIKCYPNELLNFIRKENKLLCIKELYKEDKMIILRGFFFESKEYNTRINRKNIIKDIFNY